MSSAASHGDLGLKISPFSPLPLSHFIHTNLYLQWVFSCAHLLCPSLVTSGFFLTFTFTHPDLLFLCLSFCFHTLFICLFTYVWFCLCFTLSLCHTHVWIQARANNVECLCSRSLADCAAAEMNFKTSYILLWSDEMDFDQHHIFVFVTVSVAVRGIGKLRKLSCFMSFGLFLKYLNNVNSSVSFCSQAVTQMFTQRNPAVAQQCLVLLSLLALHSILS